MLIDAKGQYNGLAGILGIAWGVLWALLWPTHLLVPLHSDRLYELGIAIAGPHDGPNALASRVRATLEPSFDTANHM